MKTIKQVGLGQGVIAVAIVVSCSGQPEQDTKQLGGPGGNEGNVAHADPVGGSGGVLQPEAVMPDNPAHISFRFQQVPDVKVKYLSVHSYPYEVTQEGDKTVVTIFPPQGVEMRVKFSPLNEDGTSFSLPSITLNIEAMAKLGTFDLEFGEVDQGVKFGNSVQKPLQAGENVVDAPSNEQFIAGTTSVRHSVYKAQFDQVCTMSCPGEFRTLRNGIAECHTGNATFSLKSGEEVGVYPVTPGTQLDSEPAHVLVEATEE